MTTAIGGGFLSFFKSSESTPPAVATWKNSAAILAEQPYFIAQRKHKHTALL
jgi:hypothetical protein